MGPTALWCNELGYIMLALMFVKNCKRHNHLPSRSSNKLKSASDCKVGVTISFVFLDTLHLLEHPTLFLFPLLKSFTG